MIYICGRDYVPNHAHIPFTHIVSIGSVEDVPNISAFREREFTLYRFIFLDISHKAENGPTLDITQRMIDAFKDILRSKNPVVLFHCAAGISRSTAAAFIFLVMADYSLQDACKEIYNVRGYTTPNLLMISFADEILKYNGVMRNFVRANFGDQAYHDYKFE